MARRWSGPICFAVRVGLPAAIAAAGIVLIIVGSDGLGVTLLVVAGLVVLTNLLMRLSISSSDDRDREQHRRRVFERTGR